MTRETARAAAPLPTDRAFVVQFREETNVAERRIAGRVEHLVSGRCAHFESLEDLLAFVGGVMTAPLERGGGDPGGRGEPRPGGRE